MNQKTNHGNPDRYHRPNHLGLSPEREQEVLQLHRKGYDNGWIAVFAQIKVSLVVKTLAAHHLVGNPPGSTSAK